MKKNFGRNFGIGIVALFLLAGWAQAAALTAARDTPTRSGEVVALGVYTNTRILAGAMVAINSNGYAVAAADATTLNVIGMAISTVDNRLNVEGAGDSGAKTIEVARGVFRWVNGDTFTDADIGDLAFVEDDQTVQKAASATYDIIAGVILDVDDDGVWVDTYDIGAQGTAAPTTLAVSGNATVGGTLGVTGLLTGRGNVAADEVDSATATTLLLGKATATKLELADTGIETEIQGTLDAQEAATFASTVGIVGVATFTVAPKFTVTTNAGSVVANSLVNLPDSSGTNAVFMTITIGSTTYAVPAYAQE